jgi:hypothetical protein
MGNGDIYVTCLLKALSTEIKIQEDEIAAAKWMNVPFPPIFSPFSPP